VNTNKYLCIIADDFGMHQAINEGIIKAFSEGILTDTNLMPPTPAFNEAIELAKTTKIPVGLHATFTCEWDNYTWGPLTNAKSITTSTGRLKKTTEEAWSDANEDEALNELREQYNAIKTKGLKMTHVGQHMSFDKGEKFEKVLSVLIEEENVPYRGDSKTIIDFALVYDWSSSFCISGPLLNLLSLD